ncbi:MAG: hypothetical protein MZU84_07565 [Sphingobacterium sp.]|nr:hypothetical protein [Sphingobacterium sp.]
MPQARRMPPKYLYRDITTWVSHIFTKKDYDNALKSFDSLLVINPGYMNAIYNKALDIQEVRNNAAAFEENIDLFIDKAKSTNDSVKVKQASNWRLNISWCRIAGKQGR